MRDNWMRGVSVASTQAPIELRYCTAAGIEGYGCGTTQGVLQNDSERNL
jgi:hypothetical protein